MTDIKRFTQRGGIGIITEIESRMRDEVSSRWDRKR